MTNAIENLATPATAVGLFSLLLFGWAATGMMAALRAGLEVAMRVDRGRPGRGVAAITGLATRRISSWVTRPRRRHRYKSRSPA